MSETKTYTERDMILAKREAFCDGHACAVGPWGAGGALDAAQKEAESRYPLPKVTRPRVVTRSDGISIRINDGALEFRLGGDESWNRYDVVSWSKPMMEAMTDLLANPTEEVDDA